MNDSKQNDDRIDGAELSDDQLESVAGGQADWSDQNSLLQGSKDSTKDPGKEDGGTVFWEW